MKQVKRRGGKAYGIYVYLNEMETVLHWLHNQKTNCYNKTHTVVALKKQIKFRDELLLKVKKRLYVAEYQNLNTVSKHEAHIKQLEEEIVAIDDLIDLVNKTYQLHYYRLSWDGDGVTRRCCGPTINTPINKKGKISNYSYNEVWCHTFTGEETDHIYDWD